jgi:hypothetical protein
VALLISYPICLIVHLSVSQYNNSTHVVEKFSMRSVPEPDRIPGPTALAEPVRLPRYALSIWLLQLTISPAYMKTLENEPPWRVRSFLDEYQEEARAAHLSVRQCVTDFFAECGNDRLILPDGHLNPAGNALIARKTMQWLKDSTVRDQLGPPQGE